MALAVVLLTGACSPARTWEAGSLLSGLGGAPAAETVVRQDFGADPPGDLYLGASARAMLVLVPGLTPAGKDDARLVAFARSLARAGFAVVVPDLPSFRLQRIGPADADLIGAAVTQAATCLPPGAPAEVALVAVSYAVAPALLAALDPTAGPKVGLLVAIGGYHSAVAAVTYVTTGRWRDADGRWRSGNPNAFGKWVFVLANAGRLESAADGITLDRLARRKLADDGAPIDDLVAKLGPEGRSVMALIGNRDPDRVPELVAALPDALRADLAGLDPAGRDLGALPARTILIHGRDDPIIPASESAALAAALPSDRTELFIIDSLGHVDLGPSGLRDGLRLWLAAYDLMAARDVLPVPDLARCGIDLPPTRSRAS